MDHRIIDDDNDDNDDDNYHLHDNGDDNDDKDDDGDDDEDNDDNDVDDDNDDEDDDNDDDDEAHLITTSSPAVASLERSHLVITGATIKDIIMIMMVLTIITGASAEIMTVIMKYGEERKITKNLNGVCDLSCLATKTPVHLAHVSACVLMQSAR